MTRLTKCKMKTHSHRILHPLLAAKVLLLLAVIGSLALAQTHLRFRTRDLRIETRKLQRKSAELKNRVSALVSKNEGLKEYDTEFRQYARGRLGLIECPPDNSSKAVVSAETLSRWENVTVDLERPAAPAPSRIRMVADMGQRVLSWSSTSMAQEPGSEKR